MNSVQSTFDYIKNNFPISQWLNSDYPNGVGIANPTSGNIMTTIKNIGDSGLDTSISGGNVTQIGSRWYQNGGANDKPYWYVLQNAQESFWFPPEPNGVTGTNFGICYAIVTSDNVALSNFGACVSRGGGPSPLNVNLYGYPTNNQRLLNEWAGSLYPYRNTDGTTGYPNRIAVNQPYCGIYNIVGNGVLSKSYTFNQAAGIGNSANTGIITKTAFNNAGGTYFGTRSTAQERYKLYEYILFKRELSVEEIYKVQNYFKLKYNQ